MNGREKSRLHVLPALRKIHTWLGVLVMPWVIVIGATGLYINHSKLILPMVRQAEFSEKQFTDRIPPGPLTEKSARLLGQELWPDEPIKKIQVETYHGRRSFIVRKKSGSIILSIPTGHYYLKTPYTRRTYSPEGELLHTKYYWHRIFKVLHTRGWIGGRFGTLLADIVSVAMVVFGLTGPILWAAPRIRRRLRD